MPHIGVQTYLPLLSEALFLFPERFRQRVRHCPTHAGRGKEVRTYQQLKELSGLTDGIFVQGNF